MKLKTLFAIVFIMLTVYGCASSAPKSRVPAAACVDKGFMNYHSHFDKYEKCRN